MGVHPLSPPFPLGNLLIECDTTISRQETLISLFLTTLLTITHVTYNKIKYPKRNEIYMQSETK